MEIYRCDRCSLNCILITENFPTRCPFGYSNCSWIKLEEKYKRCIRCGNEFIPKYEEQDYCSDVCEMSDIEDRIEEKKYE